MKKSDKKQTGKVLDFQEAYLKKLYRQDLAHSLDMYVTEKYIQQIENPVISMTLREFEETMREEIELVINQVTRAAFNYAIEEIKENPMKDPKQILEEIMNSENDEYIDENFEIHSKPPKIQDDS